MPKYLITRTDFDSMENHHSSAVSTVDVGVAPNEAVAEAIVAKYEKAAESHRYYGWGDPDRRKPYPQFYKTALCELREVFLGEEYDCQKHGHAPVSAPGLCLSCGMTMREIERERDDDG